MPQVMPRHPGCSTARSNPEGPENFMDTPMHIGRKIIRLIKQAWQLPRIASITARRQRNEWEIAEAERLDRIRNPSKYRGR
ncbi:MAG: hypothetical protein JWR26_1625 [Pedosphaera sp.]|nr:hypothetical protein [Pedosphaera sp.]